MLIRREVTDTFQIVTSVMIMSLILNSSNSEYQNNQIIFIGLSTMVIVTFLHLILLQLEILNIRHSKWITIFNLIILMIVIVGYVQHDMGTSNGFWDELNIPFSIIFQLSLIVLVFSTLISVKSVRSEAF